MDTQFSKVEGTLKKLGYRSGRWQSRKFEVKTATIIEYNGGPLGKKITLDANSWVDPIQPEEMIDSAATTVSSLHNQPITLFHALRISTKYQGGRRDFILAAHTEEDRQEWIEGLRKNINLIKWLDNQLGGSGTGSGSGSRSGSQITKDPQ